MATNGDGHLEKVEKALAEMPPMPVTGNQPALDMAAWGKQMADRAAAIGQTLAERGDDDSQDCTAFAAHLQKMLQQWSHALLTRKRRELAELEKVMGKSAG